MSTLQIPQEPDTDFQEDLLTQMLATACATLTSYGCAPTNTVVLMMKTCMHALSEIDEVQAGNVLRLLQRAYASRNDVRENSKAMAKLALAIEALVLAELAKFGGGPKAS